MKEEVKEELEVKKENEEVRKEKEETTNEARCWKWLIAVWSAGKNEDQG